MENNLTLNNPFDMVEEIIENLFFKLKGVFTTFIGWLLMLMTFFSTTFGSETNLIHYVLICIFIDLIMGAWSSFKVGTFMISYMLKSTAVKVVLYSILFFMPLFLDKIIPFDVSYLTVAVTVLLCSSSFFSIIAHMMIISPNNNTLFLIRKYFIGEIARKLKCSPSDVETLLNKKENEKSN